MHSSIMIVRISVYISIYLHWKYRQTEYNKDYKSFGFTQFAGPQSCTGLLTRSLLKKGKTNTAKTAPLPVNIQKSSHRMNHIFEILAWS